MCTCDRSWETRNQNLKRELEKSSKARNGSKERNSDIAGFLVPSGGGSEGCEARARHDRRKGERTGASPRFHH
ncbi:hypothetical protein L6164_022363 [Bauhinia variegata]|uniref:Uncharacterized protein n=1 Tax=Bauhinia variegata TaxID=167791 RepID=A0ACB9MEV4_BAUVA|nr:hypothetical protein L6164_022363 [Bauhinia variegata]